MVSCAVCTALIGGVFFAFSVFVIRALAELPARQGIAAMQRINIAVITPVFLGVFLGAVPLLGIAAFVAGNPATGQAQVWLIAALGVYTIGSVGVTVAFNVPRNNRLASLAPDSAQALDYWPVYVRQWLRWNHVRTLASLLAAAACVVAAAELP